MRQHDRNDLTDAHKQAIDAGIAHEFAKLNISPQDPADIQQARLKQRGDYYADCAMAETVRSGQEADSLKEAAGAYRGMTFAFLSLRDAVTELSATVKEAVSSTTETNAELSETVKKATKHVVIELRKATVREAA